MTSRHAYQKPQQTGHRISPEAVPGASPIATIHVRNLRLRTYIGFNPEEKSKMQDVVINLAIRHRLAGKAMQDEVEGALNYKTITKQVIELVENGSFLLLEKLAADILNVCSEDPAVEQVNVTVDKPHALRFADSVAISLEYRADETALDLVSSDLKSEDATRYQTRYLESVR